MAHSEIPARTSSAPPDEGQPFLKSVNSFEFKPTALASIPEYVPSAPAPAASVPAFTPSYPQPQYTPYSYTPPAQPGFRPPPNQSYGYQPRPQPSQLPKPDTVKAFTASATTAQDYVPGYTNVFMKQVTEAAEYKPVEFKPSAAAYTPPSEEKVAKPEEDEGIKNFELDDSDEGISNVEIDLDAEEIGATNEEAKTSTTTTPSLAKFASSEDKEGPIESDSTYTAESLTAKTVYSLAEFMKIREVTLTQEYELEARSAYFRDRTILKIEFTYEQRNNFRDKRHRGGKRQHNQPRVRQITEDQRRILEEAKRIRERLKMPQPERIAAEKKARAILNKLTPQNFEKLRDQLFDICKESEDHTTDATNAIYTRACSGNKYTEMFAMLCSFLAAKQELFFGKNYKKNQFHRALLIICEEVFRKVPADEIETDEKILLRKKAIGNMRFLGELYKKKLITTRIALEIISTLVEDLDEDKIEGACEFILSCTEKIASIHEEKLDNILARMDELKEQVSARIKFKIMDIFDAKSAGWNVKKFEAGPNKISK